MTVSDNAVHAVFRADAREHPKKHGANPLVAVCRSNRKGTYICDGSKFVCDGGVENGSCHTAVPVKTDNAIHVPKIRFGSLYISPEKGVNLSLMLVGEAGEDESFGGKSGRISEISHGIETNHKRHVTRYRSGEAEENPNGGTKGADRERIGA